MSKRRSPKAYEAITPRLKLAESISHVETAAAAIFDGAVDHDYREFAKLGDALRAVQLQLGRASLVHDGHVPHTADERARRGAEIIAAMTAYHRANIKNRILLA